MNHGSLFSGIGGFDLAAEWMGWTNKFHCEWNPFGQKVLKYYWPQTESYSDITKTDFSIWRGKIDILTGGFPCQPYSTAGKRLGKEDERHLWPEMLRAIREIQPTWIVGENVLGLVNWNGGLVFEEVQSDLEAEGYEVQPYVLPACAVNAPHRRDRVWFVAYSDSNSSRGSRSYREEQKQHFFSRSSRFSEVGVTSDTSSDRRERERKGIETQEGHKSRSESTRLLEGGFEVLCNKWNASNTDSTSGKRREKRKQSKEWSKSIKKQLRGYDKFYRANFNKFPTQPPICPRNDGLSSRLDGITFPKWRNESIKAGGNAIVPQVALQIFKAIQQYEKTYGH